ncbi:MAG TPA: hypothetical protein VF812_07090 [Ktedonobacterales bacterium]
MSTRNPSAPTMHPEAPARQPILAPIEARAPHAPSRDLTLAYRLSSALAIVAAIAAAVGVFYPAIFRDTPVTAGNARGTDLTILVVAVPALVIAMALSARGSLRAQIVWLGALSYLVYNAVFFAFDTAFNPLFLLYVATLSLALWSLVALLTHIDVADLRAHFAPSTPIHIAAIYLLVTTILFDAMWLADILPATISGGAPASLAATRMLTNPIQVLDLAVTLPAIYVGVIWLLRRRAWGYVIVGSLLVYGVVEAASIATDQFFGHLNDPTQSAVTTPIFAVLTVISLAPALLYLRGLRREQG